MTRHEAFSTPSLSSREMVLATDLDGTFLGGADADRRDFYQWIEARRDRLGLIFVTGRDPEFITQLIQSGVPRPDFVIGDVGTTIAEVDSLGRLSPITVLEQEIAETWMDAGERVRSALDGHPGLRLQPTSFRYRVSYDLDADRFDPRARDIVAEMGLDSLVSDNRYFDVLPKGVSKGPSLTRLLSYLSVEDGRTLVAGDTLNDLSMLGLGLPAVAVGGSEPALLERVAEMPHVHLAQGVGVLGIREAILRHSLVATF